jgi:hypothetical protein
MPRETIFGFSGVYFIRGNGRKLIFSLTKQFLIGNEPVYQNCQKQVKPMAM